MDAEHFDGLTRALQTTPTRRLTLGAFLSLGLVALVGGEGARAKGKGKGGSKKKGGTKGKKKQGPERVPKIWNGVWTTYHGTDQIYAGTLSLTQTGINVRGELVDPDGVHLPILATIYSGDFKQLIGTMRNAHSNNITIDITLQPDNGFRGTYSLPGPYGGAVPWTGVKQ